MYVCMYICMHACIYVFMYVCMFACLFEGTHIRISYVRIRFTLPDTFNIQGDSVARGPKLFVDNSLGPLSTESPCIISEYLW